MTERTLTDVLADIQTYEARLDALSDPDRMERMEHGARKFSRAAASPDAEGRLRRRLEELRAEARRLGGDPTAGRASFTPGLRQ